MLGDTSFNKGLYNSTLGTFPTRTKESQQRECTDGQSTSLILFLSSFFILDLGFESSHFKIAPIASINKYSQIAEKRDVS